MPWLNRSCTMDLQGFFNTVRPDNPVPYMNQKGLLKEIDEERRLLCFSILLDDKANGSYLRTFLAGTMG